MSKSIFKFLLLISLLPMLCFASEEVMSDIKNSDLVAGDIKKLFILSQQQSKGQFNKDIKIRIEFKSGSQNVVRLICKKDEFLFQVNSTDSERIPTVYYAVRRLGFLFPHPRMTFAPDYSDILSGCNSSWVWKPVLKDRGFHLHTQHAGEWVDGFFMKNKKIAEDTIWWLARNQQNLIQLQTLRLDEDQLSEYLNPLIALSKNLGIRFGLSFSFGMFQQKNFYLIPLWRVLFGINDEEALRKRLQDVIRKFNFDYATSELGTTEFTPTNYERTIRWMNIAAEELTKAGRRYYIKSHVSTNQFSKKFGNFNFLPKYADSKVGVQAHTVHFYGLRDEYTPIYGRKNFADMAEFMVQENKKREVWYFPETSYYIAMDIDVPLLLTDYLTSRADDMKFLNENSISGQVNFSTGQELGFWLFDWTICLLNDRNFNFDPMIAIKLLGEDVKTWKSLMDWQTQFIKKKQIIQQLSAANFMDEFAPLLHLVHDRNLFRRLRSRPDILAAEIKILEEALNARPNIEKIKIEELKILADLTFMRTEHAFHLRKALMAQIKGEDDSEHLEKAEQLTERGLEMMNEIETRHNRYPDSFVFRQQKNPSSYHYGYGWPAKTLHFWQREQLQIKRRSYWNPLYLNIYNPFEILL